MQQTILTAALMGGVALIGGGPALIKGLLQHLTSDKRKTRSDSMSRSLRTLLDSGYLIFADSARGKRLEITARGRRYLSMIEAGDESRPRPKKWDKKWRMVIFDIKEEKKADRQRLRDFLRKLGFLRLQNSVWVYPYDCEDLITLIKSEFKIGRGILYLIVDTIEYDRPIREHFRLHTF